MLFPSRTRSSQWGLPAAERRVPGGGGAGLGARRGGHGRAQPQSTVCGPPAAERPQGIDVRACPDQGTVPGSLRSLEAILINLATETPIVSKFWSLVIGKSFKGAGVSSTSTTESNRVLKVYFDCYFKNGFAKPCLGLCKQLPGDPGSAPPPLLSWGQHLSS